MFSKSAEMSSLNMYTIKPNTCTTVDVYIIGYNKTILLKLVSCIWLHQILQTEKVKNKAISISDSEH